MAIALVALALVSPALVLRRPPRLRMCAADSGDLGFSRARLDALPSDPATTATQMSAALTEALDSGARTLALTLTPTPALALTLTLTLTSIPTRRAHARGEHRGARAAAVVTGVRRRCTRAACAGGGAGGVPRRGVDRRGAHAHSRLRTAHAGARSATVSRAIV